MAINFSYPEIESLASGDLFVVTDISQKNATKSIKAGSLSNYIRTTVSLQDVLNVNNTATADINLTGEINTTGVITTSLIVDGTSELNGAVTLQSANILNSLSVNGDADFQTASFNNNVIFYNPTIFEDTILVPDIQFANPAVLGEKALTWNNTDGTLNLGLKGGNVTLQIGQEEVALVVNKSGIDLLEADFKVVKVLGAQGQRLSVGLAQADSDINSATTLGVVTETILNNAEGFITTVGMVNNINATGAKSFGGLETWNDGDVLYLDPVNAGYMTNVKPITPAHLITIGYVVNAASNGKIYVKIDNGYELDELHDVKITTPTADQLLAYSASEGFWKNVDLSQISDSVTTASPGIGNYVTKFNSSSTISPSTLIFDDGIGVGIGTTSPGYKLNVNGNIKGTGTSQLNHLNCTSTLSFGSFTSGVQGTLFEGYSTHSVVRTDSARLDFYMGKNITGVGTMMSLTDTGRVGIGATEPSEKLHVVGISGATDGFKIINSSGSPTINAYYNALTTTASFYVGTPFSGLSCNASAFNITSDYRLKENIIELTEAISKIKNLRPVRFNYKNKEETINGFIAHEVQNVVPEAVTGEKDALYEDGKEKYQGLDNGKLVPLLTAALQETIEKIEQLETRIQALENKQL